MSSDPWATASDKICQFISLDRHLAAEILEMKQRDAQEVQLEHALESGRTFTMRDLQYEYIKQQQLNKALQKHPLSAPAWNKTQPRMRRDSKI